MKRRLSALQLKKYHPIYCFIFLWLSFLATNVIGDGNLSTIESEEQAFQPIAEGDHLGQDLQEQIHLEHDLVTRKTITTQTIQVIRIGELRRLKMIAEKEGGVPVIIGLRTPFAPEGYLSHSSITTQRREIDNHQTLLLSRLSKLKTHRKNLRNPKLNSIPFLTLRVGPEELEVLANDPEVASIREDKELVSHLYKSVPYIDAATKSLPNESGKGYAIAILDEGFDASHPMLKDKILAESCFSLNNPEIKASSLCPGQVESSSLKGAATNCESSRLSCWHGTHVAGIALGHRVNISRGQYLSGVARDSKLIAVNVYYLVEGSEPCHGAPICSKTSESLSLSALEWIYSIRHRFKIASVNMSLGGGEYRSQATCDAENPAMKAAIDNLRSVGIATIVSAGNSGFTDALASPACISSAISVGSISAGQGQPDGNNCAGHLMGQAGLGSISCFSNSASFLSLLAPGDWILSAVHSTKMRFASMAGTSMASPHVAGAWAILRQKVPSASVAKILEALVKTGYPVQDPRNGLVKPVIQVSKAINWVNESPASVKH